MNLSEYLHLFRFQLIIGSLVVVDIPELMFGFPSLLLIGMSDLMWQNSTQSCGNSSYPAGTLQNIHIIQNLNCDPLKLFSWRMATFLNGEAIGNLEDSPEKRRHIFQEIVSTEASYVASLKKLIKVSFTAYFMVFLAALVLLIDISDASFI